MFVLLDKVGISNAYYGSKLLINPALKEAADFRNKYGLYFNCLVMMLKIIFNYFLSFLEYLSSPSPRLLTGGESYTQRISQISGHSSYSISDDLVKHTERKTIDDILDATEVLIIHLFKPFLLFFI